MPGQKRNSPKSFNDIHAKFIREQLKDKSLSTSISVSRSEYHSSQAILDPWEVLTLAISPPFDIRVDRVRIESNSGDLTYEVFTGGVISGGSQQPGVNLNRAADKAASTTLIIEPTVSAVGDLLYSSRSLADNANIDIRRNLSTVVLAESETAIIKITNQDAGPARDLYFSMVVSEYAL